MTKAARATDWASFLQTFHTEQAGITERVLSRALDAQGQTPYEWLASVTRAADADVLDLACGSAPTGALLQPVARSWVGVDVSEAELALARERGLPVRAADARSLPFADEAFDVVTISMALMLLQPLPEILRECARVLRPTGRVVATVPSKRPLSPRDVLRYGALLRALGVRALRYPNDAALRDVDAAVRGTGLRRSQDDRRSFGYDVAGAPDAETLVHSLYLPGVAPARVDAGAARLAAMAPVRLGIPLRLLVLERT